MTIYLKESVEFQAIDVTRDGTTAADFEVCIVQAGARAEGWEPAAVVDGKPGVMIEGLDFGDYWIYVRIQDNPETPVLRAGTVTIR